MTEKPKRTYTRKVWAVTMNGRVDSVYLTKMEARKDLGRWRIKELEIVPAMITYSV